MTLDFVQENFTIGQKSPDLSPQFIFYKRGFRLNGSSGSTPEWKDIILKGNTALTLVNAKENGLNYLKLFGGTSQRNLPVGYTQVEYIESDGTQYIDTGVATSNDMKAEIRGKFLSVDKNTSMLLAARSGTDGFNSLIAWNNNEGGGYFTQFNNSKYARVVMPKDTNIHILQAIITPTNTITSVDSSTDTLSIENVGYNLNLYINARNIDGTSVSNISTYRYYYVKIWKSGNIVRDFVPAKNSSNVVGMYDLVSGQFFTNAGTGTFMAGAEAVPSPDTPMDIVSNNGVLKVRQNIWKGNYADLGYLDETGAVKPTTGYMASDFIEIDQSKKYTFYEQIISAYTGNGMRICFYNSSKQMVGVRQGGEAKEINSYAYVAIPPAGAKYIRVSTGVSANNVTSITLVEGEYDTTTIQGVVGSIYTDGTTETVAIHSKNLFDENDVILGYFYKDNGTYTANNNTFTSGKIPMNAGATVTFSRGSYVNNAYLRIHAFDSDDNWIDLVAKSSTPNGLICTGTTPANTSYIRACGSKLAGSDEIDNECQIELGSTATTYEPYFNGGTATAEMLLAISSYQDIQSVLDGEVTRKVGIKVLDGTESWFEVTGYTGIYGLAVADGVLPSNTACVCSHYLGTTASNVTMENDTIKAVHASLLAPNKISIYIKDTDVGSLANFKTYLETQYQNGQPIICAYPLVTATTETVTAQPLTIQAGTNIVEITEASIDNLELEVSYKGTL